MLEKAKLQIYKAGLGFPQAKRWDRGMFTREQEQLFRGMEIYLNCDDSFPHDGHHDDTHSSNCTLKISQFYCKLYPNKGNILKSN